MEPISKKLAGGSEATERNWIPLAVAATLVIAIVIAGLVLTGRPKSQQTITPIATTADPYATNLPITNLAMSESSNLAGGKVTYVDGLIANKGPRTVSGVTVQVFFRSYTHEVAQNDTLPLKLISMREPYIDTVPVGASPIKPGSEQNFRLTFDRISQKWAGGLPEIRILHVDFR